MKEKMYLPFGAVAVLLSSVVSADTLLWYRFDGTGDTVVNVANPGFMDGKLKSVESNWGSVSYVLGDDSAKFPVYGGNAFPDGFTLHDPIGGTNCIAPRKMSWTESVHAGLVVAQGASNLHAAKKSLTVEAFFRLKPESVSRSQRMHPIVNCGWDDKVGYMFSVMDGKPFLRLRYLKTDGTESGTGSSMWLANQADNALPDNLLYDGRWHHMAFSIAENGDTALYLDYQIVYTTTLSLYNGLYFDSSDSAHDIFQVGATLHTNKRSLFGDIAELRISDSVLEPGDFLRPVQVVDGVVDDDTFLYLPLGNLSWFAQPTQTGYTNALEYIAPYAPVSGSSCRPFMIRSTNASEMPSFPVHDADTALAQVRDGILSGNTVTNMGSMRFFRKTTVLNTGSTDLRDVGHAVSVPTDEVFQTDDFTMEFFFRQPTVLSSSTNKTATLVYSPWAKICINQTDGKLLSRPFYEAEGKKGKYYSNLSTKERVDDDQWHHYAFVWEQETSNAVFFIDYECVGSLVVSNGLQHTASSPVFNIGCESTVNVQAFDGLLDDVRITRRVLRPHEFLTSRLKAGPSNVLFHARFENDFSSGLGSDIVGDGTPRRINGNNAGKGEVPELKSLYQNAKVFADAGLTNPVPNTGYVRLDGGEVYWPHNSLLERNRLTIEFFAAFDECPNGSNLIRFSPGYNSYNPNPYGKPSMPVWGIYTRRSETEDPSLMFVTMTCTNIRQRIALFNPNAESADVGRKDREMEVGDVMQDGRWHHWAITFDVTEENNTLYRFWCDYEVVFEAEREGLLNIPLHGSVLEIGGTGNTTALVHARYDEIRITDGVLTPDRFMRRGYPGFMFICR